MAKRKKITGVERRNHIDNCIAKVKAAIADLQPKCRWTVAEGFQIDVQGRTSDTQLHICRDQRDTDPVYKRILALPSLIERTDAIAEHRALRIAEVNDLYAALKHNVWCHPSYVDNYSIVITIR